eukprot:850730_1
MSLWETTEECQIRQEDQRKMEMQQEQLRCFQQRRTCLADTPAVLTPGDGYRQRLIERARIAIRYPEQASDMDRQAVETLLLTAHHNAEIAAVKSDINSTRIEQQNINERVRQESQSA